MFLNDFDLDLGFLRGFPLTIGQRGAKYKIEISGGKNLNDR
jgi:hypothetical protein